MLLEHVQVARRFQRATRIDVDIGDPKALEGFISSHSTVDTLETMAQHVIENEQGAFTWTGSYGSGKSSLAVVLAALLGGDPKVREKAARILGRKTANKIWEAFPVKTKGWKILPIVGRRERPEQVIGEGLSEAGYWEGDPPDHWKEKQVLTQLNKVAKLHPRSSGGLIVLVDEMGKFLESVASEGADIYLFQQIAELASRSKGRLIFVGILHQAFGEYAHRLSRDMRDEWSKVQGRFVDLSIRMSGGEQVDLISRTIERPKFQAKGFDTLAKGVAGQVQKHSPSNMAAMLENCWPLHPVTACLLGPISQRRFGQSQRSIFGFLNSAEPDGFQDFLREADEASLYKPADLWDYLQHNMEPSILASPDGHRWAVAKEALDRCATKEHGKLHLQLLKTIALLDMLKSGSGLKATLPLLKLTLRGDGTVKSINSALKSLTQWSLIVYRKYTESYSIFEGSDFDIDQAVEQMSRNLGEPDFSSLDAFTQLQPIVAKRHYHETGTLRWFDVMVVALSKVEEIAQEYTPQHGAVGIFFLTLPTQSESAQAAGKICRRVVRDKDQAHTVVVGTSWAVRNIPLQVRELTSLERVRDEMPELLGDKVARAEVNARIESIQAQLERALRRAFEEIKWFCRTHFPQSLGSVELNGFASDLADENFKKAPRIHNELLNRTKPSSSATAGMNALLRHMVSMEGQPRLGIRGFPAEGGLFSSVLEATKLYRNVRNVGWKFMPPRSGSVADPGGLYHAWRAARVFLEENKNKTVSAIQIYDIWKQPPYGIKDGLLPVLLMAFFLSQRETLAFYRQGVFQARVSDLDVDYLTSDPSDIQLRRMDFSARSQRLLADMADVVRDMDRENTLSDLEPIDVARGLIAVYDQLPPWIGRTQHLSKNAQSVRQLFKNAKDPNKLIFDDIPKILAGDARLDSKKALVAIESKIRGGLEELRSAYPSMLDRLKGVLLNELQVPNASIAMLEELRARAANVRELGGDHRLEAFVMRLAEFTGDDKDIENLGSMAINKPVTSWVDADIDRAAVNLAEMAQQFVRIEAFTRVKGRAEKRHAMALVTSSPSGSGTLHGEFHIVDAERDRVDTLRTRLKATLQDSGEKQHHIILATLIELSAQYLQNDPQQKTSEGTNES